MDEFHRIGDKLISRRKVAEQVDEILRLRAAGLSQQEVATRMGLDRTFISRLETLGEVRKGGTVAVLGFPVGNKEALVRVTQEEGVDFVFLMTESERIAYTESLSGARLVNDILALTGRLRTYDTVVVLGSDARVKLVRAILDREVIPIVIGQSPLSDDVMVDPEVLRKALRSLRS